jgi:hypothetical protein
MVIKNEGEQHIGGKSACARKSTKGWPEKDKYLVLAVQRHGVHYELGAVQELLHDRLPKKT